MSASIREILVADPVLPVVTIENPADAVPLARALVSGGVRTLEVTLRTATALDSIRAIASEVPEVVIGAGTVVTPADLQRACDAGARFGVTPGVTRDLLAAGRASGIPLLPGVLTPSEVLSAVAAGFTVLKLFPAQPAGGVALLKALAGPFPDIVFCPTGGISFDLAREYLALANVFCVGGSWITPPDAIRSGNWAEITGLARMATGLRRRIVKA